MTLKGSPTAVDKAVAMIQEVLTGVQEEPKGKAGGKGEANQTTRTVQAKGKGSGRAPKEFKGSLSQDFPTLGMGDGPGGKKKSKRQGAWAKNGKEDEEDEPEQAADDEEEDDPFAMMSGMGAEEVYKETLTIAGKEGAQVEVESEEEEEDGAAEESKGNKWVEDAPEDEEEEEEEEDDPFAMMSGMGAEEVYKETLTIAGKEGAQVE